MVGVAGGGGDRVGTGEQPETQHRNLQFPDAGKQGLASEMKSVLPYPSVIRQKHLSLNLQLLAFLTALPPIRDSPNPGLLLQAHTWDALPLSLRGGPDSEPQTPSRVSTADSSEGLHPTPTPQWIVLLPKIHKWDPNGYICSWFLTSACSRTVIIISSGFCTVLEPHTHGLIGGSHIPLSRNSYSIAPGRDPEIQRGEDTEKHAVCTWRGFEAS